MSKENSNVNVSFGGGFSGLLTIVFITLKLIGYINWSWVWVLSPLWISVALWLAMVVLAFVVTGIFYFFFNK